MNNIYRKLWFLPAIALMAWVFTACQSKSKHDVAKKSHQNGYYGDRGVANQNFTPPAQDALVNEHEQANLPKALKESQGKSYLDGNGHVDQAKIPRKLKGGALRWDSLDRMRDAGVAIFATEFNALDGRNGRPNDSDSPTPDGIGIFSRLSGLDASSCTECHHLKSTNPHSFAIGGHAGIANSVFPPFQANPLAHREFKMEFPGRPANSFATSNGLANPASLFGSGITEHLGKEITVDLRNKRIAYDAACKEGKSPEAQDLTSKGVVYGKMECSDKVATITNDPGIRDDFIIRPIGRVGVTDSLRPFTAESYSFHFGIQNREALAAEEVLKAAVTLQRNRPKANLTKESLPIAIATANFLWRAALGEKVDQAPEALKPLLAGIKVPEDDEDKDGVTKLEMTRGDVSAAHIAIATMPLPLQVEPAQAFVDAQCTKCHVASMPVDREEMTFQFPVLSLDPFNEITTYAKAPFSQIGHGYNKLKENDGKKVVYLYSDLKRHDMGPGLARPRGDGNQFWRTTPLMGVADTGPWLHDGRATTLTEAVLAHGGEAADSVTAFRQNPAPIIQFLKSLKGPQSLPSSYKGK